MTSVCCMKCGGDILVAPALCAGCAPDLVAQRDALKAALRARSIHDLSDYNDAFIQCDECGECWTKGAAEEHAPGCLAAEDAP